MSGTPETAAAGEQETAPKPARPRKNTVSLPGRGSAGAVVDAPSVVDDLRSRPLIPSTATGGVAPVPLIGADRPDTEPAPVAPSAPQVAPPPPPKKQAPPRVQFSTKLPPALITDVKDFSDHHQAEIQVVVELALREYMTSRGWEISS